MPPEGIIYNVSRGHLYNSGVFIVGNIENDIKIICY